MKCNVKIGKIGIFITFFQIETRPACTVIIGDCVFYSGEIEVLYYDYLTVTAEEITDTSIVPPTASDASLGAGHSEGTADDHPCSSSPPTIHPANHPTTDINISGLLILDVRFHGGPGEM